MLHFVLCLSLLQVISHIFVLSVYRIGCRWRLTSIFLFLLLCFFSLFTCSSQLSASVLGGPGRLATARPSRRQYKAAHHHHEHDYFEILEADIRPHHHLLEGPTHIPTLDLCEQEEAYHAHAINQEHKAANDAECSALIALNKQDQ